MRQSKIDSVMLKYPSLTLLPERGGAADRLVWEGWVQPIRSMVNLSAILDDLENNRAVIISDSGEIKHDSQCLIEHTEHRLISKLVSATRLFKIRIEDFCSNQMPSARVLDPKITEDLRRHTIGADGICGFAPWEYPWNANTSSIVEYIDHCMVWLLKWNVFAQTSEWIGSETHHDSEFLINTIRPTQNCHCGSGKTYELCCRIINGTILFGEVWIFFEKWLLKHRLNANKF